MENPVRLKPAPYPVKNDMVNEIKSVRKSAKLPGNPFLSRGIRAKKEEKAHGCHREKGFEERFSRSSFKCLQAKDKLIFLLVIILLTIEKSGVSIASTTLTCRF
jgi:hypothetical protein